ncbi:MAG: tetratricopeptide repeat protein [Pirellulales bacterium]|nr:tetratricopeptide repeat protein [Pirellulales bacterium]
MRHENSDSPRYPVEFRLADRDSQGLRLPLRPILQSKSNIDTSKSLPERPDHSMTSPVSLQKQRPNTLISSLLSDFDSCGILCSYGSDCSRRQHLAALPRGLPKNGDCPQLSAGYSINWDGIPMNDWMDAEARVERAHKLYQKGRWVEAAAELRAAIEANPYNASWYFNLGLTLEAMEDYSKACEAYESAKELESDDIETLNCLGVNLTRIGHYAESLECFETIEKIDPTYEPCYCNRIVTYTEFGQHDEAELMFYMARQFMEECPLCYFNIGTSHYMRNNYDRAIDCWKQVLRLDSKHSQTHSRIGDAYWAKGDLQKAREHYQAELEAHGEDIEALLDLGEVLLELDELESAEAQFRRVVKLQPDNAAAYFCLGELAEKREEPNTAEACYRKTLSLDASYSGVHARLARLMLHRGKNTQAAKHLQAELRKAGDDPTSLQEIGELLIEARLTDKAHKVLSKLVQLQPNDAHAQHNLAVSCFMMDRLDEGILHCRKALKLNPDYPLALYNMALAHLHKDQIDRARRYAARAMTLAPQDENIQRLAKRLGMNGLWSRLRIRLVPKRKRRDIYYE